MINPPKTPEEAAAITYDLFGHVSYCKEKCAYRVSVDAWHSKQCSKKPGHGPAGLYCQQHAKMIGEQNA